MPWILCIGRLKEESLDFIHSLIMIIAIAREMSNPLASAVGYRFIRSSLKGALPVLFALAITPKIAIHALVAHHTDTHPSLKYGNADQYNEAGFYRYSPTVK
ncbi:MAG TPA: hypothetical protein VHE34_25980 [Puia sp.]|uniref:hypothetical protein n=1 Tax=Puia sp. TaxID=2045100 RepID=UPI002BBCD84C|nr:hypothetical protein [Puia sp.]HVU98709.1 hypothetical protein [Puia sp.]